MEDIFIPALGMAMEEASLVEWLKDPGDPIAAGDQVAIIETDKATLELTAATSGVLGAHRFAEGDQVPAGRTVTVVLGPGESEDDSAPVADGPAGTPAASDARIGERRWDRRRCRWRRPGFSRCRVARDGRLRVPAPPPVEPPPASAGRRGGSQCRGARPCRGTSPDGRDRRDQRNDGRTRNGCSLRRPQAQSTRPVRRRPKPETPRADDPRAPQRRPPPLGIGSHPPMPPLRAARPRRSGRDPRRPGRRGPLERPSPGRSAARGPRSRISRCPAKCGPTASPIGWRANLRSVTEVSRSPTC